MNKTAIDGILRDFYTVSKMDVSLVNADFHTVSVFRDRDGGLCSFIQKDKKIRDACRVSDIERLDEVKKSCEATVYTCPCGIVEVIVPVIREGGIIAYLFCSMGVLEDERESVVERVSKISGEISSNELSRVMKCGRILTNDEISAYLSILKIVAEHIARDTSPMVSDESIGKLIKYYVKNNLDRKITLSDIALSLHCSTVTLTEHFKSEFGITIMEYVTKKRMEFAEKLLLTTDEPLREIATMSGFADVEYFSRTFKKHYGASPASWRKSKKAKRIDFL